MDLTRTSIYKYLPEIIRGPIIDISECGFIHPWALVLITLLLVERHGDKDKKILLPKDATVLSYLKRVHFDQTLMKLSYTEESNFLQTIEMNERDNLNLQELTHCSYRDEFNSRLERFAKIFINFGLGENQARLVVALIGELGNNVFDHNALNWPTDVSGCFLTAQNYPLKNFIEFAIGDPGIGFLGSLKANYPEINDDISAIKQGLAGKTGRINERRGNGLQFVQRWTLTNFRGKVAIHSGEGLIIIDQDGVTEHKVHRILGTIVQIMLYYK
jgi:hypothetical protein